MYIIIDFVGELHDKMDESISAEQFKDCFGSDESGLDCRELYVVVDEDDACNLVQSDLPQKPGLCLHITTTGSLLGATAGSIAATATLLAGTCLTEANNASLELLKHAVAAGTRLIAGDIAATVVFAGFTGMKLKARVALTGASTITALVVCATVTVATSVVVSGVEHATVYAKDATVRAIKRAVANRAARLAAEARLSEIASHTLTGYGDPVEIGVEPNRAADPTGSPDVLDSPPPDGVSDVPVVVT